MYKVGNYILLELIREVYTFYGEMSYDLRQENFFRKTLAKFVYNNTERVAVLGSKIWEIIPETEKNGNQTSAFAGYLDIYTEFWVSGMISFLTQLYNNFIKWAFEYF